MLETQIRSLVISRSGGSISIHDINHMNSSIVILSHTPPQWGVVLQLTFGSNAVSFSTASRLTRSLSSSINITLGRTQIESVSINVGSLQLMPEPSSYVTSSSTSTTTLVNTETLPLSSSVPQLTLRPTASPSLLSSSTQMVSERMPTTTTATTTTISSTTTTKVETVNEKSTLESNDNDSPGALFWALLALLLVSLAVLASVFWVRKRSSSSGEASLENNKGPLNSAIMNTGFAGTPSANAELGLFTDQIANHRSQHFASADSIVRTADDRIDDIRMGANGWPKSQTLIDKSPRRFSPWGGSL